MSLQAEPQSKLSNVIAVCGNPNCGKTTIFNHITGLNQHVGNYPGVTVERIVGQFSLKGNPQKYSLIDIPGTYSLAAFTPDEYIAASSLFGEIENDKQPDVIIAVLDATNLERSFYLLLQILQTNLPIVVAVNMIDIARKRGIDIDCEKLSQILNGVPVFPVVGNKGEGVEEVKAKAVELLNSPKRQFEKIYCDETEEVLDKLKDTFGDTKRSRAHYARIIFDVNGEAEKRFISEEGPHASEIIEEGRKKIIDKIGYLSQAETSALTKKSEDIYSHAVKNDKNKKNKTRTEKIDKIVLHPIAGPILLVLMMYFVFQSIFSWAEPFMNVIDSFFVMLSGLVESSMVEGPLRSLITDGIIGGVGSVLIFIPQIVILFLFIALLEDSGYMPRAAFLVDRMFRWCGLSGKSFIPMLSSFACAVPGIMATRTIEDKKLRFMTIFIAPLMTCSARLPVYAIMISAFLPYKSYYGIVNLQGITLTLLYLLGVVVAVLVSFILKKTIFKTEIGTFLMELPSYKIPTAKSVIIRVFNRAKQFVIRAGTVIMAITIIIWALSYYPNTGNDVLNTVDNQAQTEEQIQQLENEAAGQQIRNSYLGKIGKTIEPVFKPLGWDWKITMSVLASFPAREVIIAVLGTIYNLGSDENEESTSLIDKMRQAKWEDGDKVGQPVFTVAVAISIMVFFALCCQCGATLVTIKQETNSWGYPVAVFTYMTVLAYICSFVSYQLLTAVGL